MHDLKGSNGITEAAACIFSIHRNDEQKNQNQATLTVLKNRHGKTGDCLASYQPWLFRFSNLSPAAAMENKENKESEGMPF